MRADNSRHVIAAARRRATATRTRAVAALLRMDKTGLPINFDSLAKRLLRNRVVAVRDVVAGCGVAARHEDHPRHDRAVCATATLAGMTPRDVTRRA
jgi:hypothetical protein